MDKPLFVLQLNKTSGAEKDVAVWVRMCFHCHGVRTSCSLRKRCPKDF